jgi:hypothetical protein
MINRGTSVGAAASDISIGASVAVASIISSAMVVFYFGGFVVRSCLLCCLRLMFSVVLVWSCGDK